MYYFAYGSNMDEKDLKDWCKEKNRSFPEWKLLGTACLNGYQLSFNYYSTGRNGGAANLMEPSDSKVYGLLFEINKEYDIETIRKKEGCPDYYGEIPITVKYKDKNITNVKTYKVVKTKEKSGHQKPTKYYMNLILKNARTNEFPPEYIQYLEKIETQ
ncbi:MAG: gamma-glutamylcyclotransferase [Deltaproteobacteria bacterium]|nr:gamma-glutamylcyclotransferase [Deltaproteobacteria bacterium]